MQIEYYFSSDFSTNIIKVDETALRYNLFLGNLTLKKGKDSINANWDWIPLLDFALCLLEICENLSGQVHGCEEFEFTESDAKLIFEKKNDRINIIASFTDETLDVSLEELHKATERFYKEILSDILEKNQQLKENMVFAKYLKKTEQM
jgi:hypothetical protein